MRINSGSDDEFVPLTYYVRILVIHWRTIVGVMLLFTLITATYAFTAEKRYRVEAVLAPVNSSGAGAISSIVNQAGPLAGMLGLGSLSQNSNSREAIARLQSKGFLYQFIETRQIARHLFPEEWSEEHDDWRKSEDEDIPTVSDAYEIFVENVLDVDADSDSEFWTVSLLWRDPVQAKAWLESIIYDVNEITRQKDLEAARLAIAYLSNKALETSAVSVREAIYSVLEVHLQTESLAQSRKEYALKVISEPVVPSANHFDYPRRGMLVVLGVLGGCFFGVFIALILGEGAQLPEQSESKKG